MPNTVNYKGEIIIVENAITLEGDPITSIPAERLFVGQADSYGDRYAYDIKEIETYIEKFKKPDTIYTKPKEAFSVQDLLDLSQRSPKIKEFLINTLNQTKKTADEISQETLEQMKIFAKHVRGSPTEFKEEELTSIMRKYSEELDAFGDTEVSIWDLLRGDAFDKFKKYYHNLSDSEKSAIDALPAVKEVFAMFGLRKSVAEIFDLKGESCLGGTAGICKAAIASVEFLHSLEKARGAIVDNNQAPADAKKEEIIPKDPGLHRNTLK